MNKDISRTQQEELNRLANRAINKGYITDKNDMITEINSYGALWVTIPNVHGKGRSAIFTILSNEAGTEFETFSGKYGK